MASDSPTEHETDANTPTESSTEGADGNSELSEGSVAGAVLGSLGYDEEAESSTASESDEGTTEVRPDAEAKPEGEQPEAAETTEGQTEEEPPFHQHPRWKELKAERDDLRQQAEQYRSSHEQWGQLTEYMERSNLSMDEANTGFQIMALMKNDPHKALEALAPYVSQLQEVTGASLPPDLQERVENGYVDEDTARELARMRHQDRSMRSQAEQARQQAHQRVVSDVQTSLNGLESEWKGSDPDWAVKRGRVFEKLQLHIVTQGFPSSGSQAMQVARQIKQAVDAEMAQLAPKRRSSSPDPGSDRAASMARPSPKSTQDAVLAALGHSV